MRRRGRGLGGVAAAACIGITGTGVVLGVVTPATAATAPTGPTVLVGCLGVDPGATGPQIRVGFVTSGPDGLYRAVFAGPAGPVQGEGRVVGGRGLVIVPSAGPGEYDDLVLTDVDTGQAIDRGPLGAVLPFRVGDDSVGCDPAGLVVPTGDAAPTTPAPTDPPATDPTAAPTPDPTGTPTPDISTATPLTTGADDDSSTDTPPWLLLLIPGVLLAGGGVFLLVRGRSGSRSRPAT